MDDDTYLAVAIKDLAAAVSVVIGATARETGTDAAGSAMAHVQEAVRKANRVLNRGKSKDDPDYIPDPFEPVVPPHGTGGIDE